MSAFTAGQKALYVLSAPLYVAYGLWIWRLVKKPMEDGENLLERFNWFYSVAAGALVVKLLTNVLPHGSFTYYALAVTGMTLSFACMYFVQQCMRVWHSNETYIMPGTVAESQEPLLNSGSMTENNHLRTTDLHAFRDQYLKGQDIVKDKTRRRVVMAVLYWTILYLTVLDGFYAVYWSDKSPLGAWGIAGLSWVVRALDSTLVYCALVHALIPTMKKTRWFKWLFAYSTLSALWFVTLVLSTLPALTDMSVDQATFIVTHPAWALSYGLGGGVLLWMTTYFTWLNSPAPTRASVKRRLILFTSVLVVGGVVGIFV